MKAIPLAVVLAVAPVILEAGGPKITKESLVSAGKKRTYYLYLRSKDINEHAWAFLTRQALETDPKYITYAIPAR